MSSRKSKPYLTPEQLALKEHPWQINRAIIRKPPFCQGIIPLPSDDFTLFYAKDANARQLNLANVSSEEPQHLAGTCDPATFGLGQEAVHDETYHKAGKLGASDSMLRCVPDTSGILNDIRTELLVEGRGSEKSVRAELYMLNVYGPDALFKSHVLVDTPGSLQGVSRACARLIPVITRHKVWQACTLA